MMKSRLREGALKLHESCRRWKEDKTFQVALHGREVMVSLQLSWLGDTEKKVKNLDVVHDPYIYPELQHLIALPSLISIVEEIS